MKIAVLTSDHLRHKFFSHFLSQNHEIVAVIAEKKGNEKQMSGDTPEETEVLKHHFRRRIEMEDLFFGKHTEFSKDIPMVREIERGELNSPEILEMVKKATPEGIAVFGCGILKEPLINICPDTIINAHQGLSPYYRGSGTNFWPFYNEEIEYVGVTVHYIDPGIDTGGIICHGRPKIEEKDDNHSIGCKTIILSAQLVSDVFTMIEKGREIISFPQSSKGKLYQRKDFNADAVKQVYSSLEDGLVKKYLQKKQQEQIPPIQLINLE